MGNIRPLQKKSVSNETASQEQQFKLVKSPKIALEFKNLPGSEKLRYSYKIKRVYIPIILQCSLDVLILTS